MSSIDQLKSLASSKLGFARSNQFLVELILKKDRLQQELN